MLSDKNKFKISMLLIVLLTTLLAYSLYYQWYLPFSYITISIIFAVVLTISVIKLENYKFNLIQIFILYFVIRNIYYIATEYKLHPFVDPYYDYAVSRMFLENNCINILTMGDGISQQIMYNSEFPLLHTFTLIFIKMSNIDIFSMSIIIAELLMLIIFLFVYLLVKKIVFNLNLNKKIITLSMLFYSVVPETIFWVMFFKYQNMAILFLIILFYLIFKCMNNIDYRYNILISIIIISMTLSHHVTSVNAALYLLMLAVLYYLNQLIPNKDNEILHKINITKDYKKHKYFLRLFIIFFICIFAMWNYYSTTIWTSISLVITKFIEILLGLRELESGITMVQYPPEMTPLWSMILIRLRDVLTYGSVIFGFILFFGFSKKETHNMETVKKYVLFSLISFGIIYSMNFATRFPGVGRTITYAMPFIVFLMSIFYSNILNSKKTFHGIKYISVIGSIFLCIIMFSTFIGLWGHNYAPTHLYNNSINVNIIGEHEPNYMRASQFTSKIEYQNFKHIYSDDFPLLMVLLPTKEYNKIGRIKELKNKSNDILFFKLNNLNLYYYDMTYSVVIENNQYKTPIDVLQNNLKEILKYDYNSIYNDGKFEVKYKKV